MSRARTVWVLEEVPGGPALAVAERLGAPVRVVPLAFNRLALAASLAPRGSLAGLAAVPAALRGAAGPSLVLAAGARAGAVALWARARLGCPAVQCVPPGLLSAGVMSASFDLAVVPEGHRAFPGTRVLPLLCPPSRLSPQRLHQAEIAWHERLVHLPRPRVVLRVGGPSWRGELEPALAHAVGRQVARLAGARGGSVLATTGPNTGQEATEALAAGLAPAMHVLHRHGEPDEDPAEGFLAMADIVVIAAGSETMLADACATPAPVYHLLAGHAPPGARRLTARLEALGQVRRLGRRLEAWPRSPLDEAGRAAAEIARLFASGTADGPL